MLNANEVDVITAFSVNPEITCTHASLPPTGAISRGEKIQVGYDVHLAGTSLNVALAVMRCGYTPLLLGAVGKDQFGFLVEKELSDMKMPHLLIAARAKTPLAIYESQIDRCLSGKTPIISVDEAEAIIGNIALPKQPKFVLATGLMPDENEIRLTRALFSLKGFTGKKILNPRQYLTKERRLFSEIARQSDWLILNRFEAAAYLDCSPEEITCPRLRPFLDLGLQRIIATRDGKGVILIDRGGVELELPPINVGEKQDEAGAGDCFLGFFLGGILAGLDTKQSFQRAHVAGALKTLRLGAPNQPTLDEVISVHRRYPWP